MNFTRKNIVQPSDYWFQFEKAASAAGKNLSEWIGEQCLAALPPETVKELPERSSMKSAIFKRRAAR